MPMPTIGWLLQVGVYVLLGVGALWALQKLNSFRPQEFDPEEDPGRDEADRDDTASRVERDTDAADHQPARPRRDP